uniref:Store-operated calcium entry-associated regulatory factor n=1 Tax=Macrostomum lignano TaxID=282301 RepID=A0A1I8JBL0_9PLAT
MKYPIAILIIFCVCPEFGHANRRVLLSTVQTLTLHRDKFTTGRRSSPIPQLKCIDGKSSCSNLPSSVQCYNQGSDGIDVQWKCEAQLPKSTQFDKLQVQCEGYDYPDDPYILAGSCGLTYSLKPAGGSRSHKSRSGHKSRSHRQAASDSDNSVSPVIVIAVLAIAGYCIYAFFLAPSANRVSNDPSAPPPPAYDDYDDGDQPPPYTPGGPGAPQYGFRPEFTAGAGSSPGGYGKAYQRRAYQQNQAQPDDNSSSGPGFWSGAAIGGLTGYLFGNSNSRRAEPCGYYGSSEPCGGGAAYSRHSSTSSSASSVDTAPTTRTGYSSTGRR